MTGVQVSWHSKAVSDQWCVHIIADENILDGSFPDGQLRAMLKHQLEYYFSRLVLLHINSHCYSALGVTYHLFIYYQDIYSDFSDQQWPTSDKSGSVMPLKTSDFLIIIPLSHRLKMQLNSSINYLSCWRFKDRIGWKIERLIRQCPSLKTVFSFVVRLVISLLDTEITKSFLGSFSNIDMHPNHREKNQYPCLFFAGMFMWYFQLYSLEWLIKYLYCVTISIICTFYKALSLLLESCHCLVTYLQELIQTWLIPLSGFPLICPLPPSLTAYWYLLNSEHA